MRRFRAYLIRFRRELSALCAGLAALTLGAHLHPLGSSRIVVAAHAITAGQQVRAADLVEVDSLLAWAAQSPARADLIGRAAAVDIEPGEPMTRHSVVSPRALTSGARVAVTIEVSPADARLVRAGDHIDVLATDAEGQASTAAANASVVAVPAATEVVIAVLPGEARSVAAARGSSAYTVVLRPDV